MTDLEVERNAVSGLYGQTLIKIDVMYTGAIIGYLSWPFMILVSYLAVRWALRKFEKRYQSEESVEE